MKSWLLKETWRGNIMRDNNARNISKSKLTRKHSGKYALYHLDGDWTVIMEKSLERMFLPRRRCTFKALHCWVYTTACDCKLQWRRRCCFLGKLQTPAIVTITQHQCDRQRGKKRHNRNHNVITWQPLNCNEQWTSYNGYAWDKKAFDIGAS